MASFKTWLLVVCTLFAIFFVASAEVSTQKNEEGRVDNRVEESKYPSGGVPVYWRGGNPREGGVPGYGSGSDGGVPGYGSGGDGGVPGYGSGGDGGVPGYGSGGNPGGGGWP